MSALEIKDSSSNLVVFVVNDIDNKVTAQLAHSGYSISNIRGSCSGVMRAIEKSLPDLVVTCIGTTGKFGTKLCREMKNRRETRAIPVVFVAKEDSSKDVNTAFVYGCIDYLEPGDVDIKEKLARYTKMGKMEKSLKRLRDRYDNICDLEGGL